ncbi:hypothetical protein D8S78_00780 [Natrialba swarupiae]|nr:hypothetical protein [Natrialba swarupiae]
MISCILPGDTRPARPAHRTPRASTPPELAVATAGHATDDGRRHDHVRPRGTDERRRQEIGDRRSTRSRESLSPCPVCGTPIVRRTIVGPTEAVADPCGCRVTPNSPTRGRSHRIRNKRRLGWCGSIAGPTSVRTPFGRFRRVVRPTSVAPRGQHAGGYGRVSVRYHPLGSHRQ